MLSAPLMVLLCIYLQFLLQPILAFGFFCIVHDMLRLLYLYFTVSPNKCFRA